MIVLISSYFSFLGNNFQLWLIHCHRWKMCTSLNLYCGEIFGSLNFIDGNVRYVGWFYLLVSLRLIIQCIYFLSLLILILVYPKSLFSRLWYMLGMWPSQKHSFYTLAVFIFYLAGETCLIRLMSTCIITVTSFPFALTLMIYVMEMP